MSELTVQGTAGQSRPVKSVNAARTTTTLAVLAALIAASCSSGDESSGTDTNVVGGSTTATTLFDGSSNEQVIASANGAGTDAATGTGFDPSIVDEALVPVTVEEVVLGDDVIIATEDGAVPTTTTEPPPSGEDAALPPENESTTTLAPTPPPAAEEVQRVVSLSPTHTDTIAALGAADLLVGIDSFSDAPAGAPIESDQFLADDLATDTLRALDVDLVVLGDDIEGLGAQSLSAAGIAFFDGARPSTRAGVEQQILDLAAAIDRDAAGQQLVTSMRVEVADIIASLPSTDGLTYFHEIDPGYATYAPGSLIDSLYGELGLTSIVPPSNATTVFLRPDDVIGGDPDVVVLGDIVCCAATAERAAGRSGWDQLSATQNGAIVEVPDDTANRFGTNIVDLMRLVAAGVAAAA